MPNPDQFTNFATTTVAGGAGGAGTPLNPADTTLLLSSAAAFPASAPFSLVLSASGNTEIVRCTAIASVTCTITRAQEGTTALTWAVGAAVALEVTALAYSNLWKAAPQVYNVRGFGAKGDGVTDDTTAITAALTAASGGGVVRFPAGTYLSGPQTLLSNVWLVGDGLGVTTIKLKNAANADLFSAFTANISMTAFGFQLGPSTGITQFGIRDMTLDGNYTNQTAGPCYPLRFYGYGYTLQNLEILHGYTGGVLCDYSGPFPSNNLLESTWINVRSHDNKGLTTSIGIEFFGPHDSRFTNVLSYFNNSHSLHVAGANSGGLQLVGCHFWSSGLADTHSATALMESSFYATNTECEGSPQAQLVVLNSGWVFTGGAIYAGANAGLGIQLGQAAGATPYTNSIFQAAGLTTLGNCSSYVVNTIIENITHASGAIWFNTDSGGVLIARVLAASGTNTLYTGTIGSKTTLILNTQGFNSPTPQQMTLYGGGHSGQGGPLSYGMAAQTDPGTGGTIATTGSSVIPILPAAAETGVILGAGQFDGQVVIVVNASGANSVTFAAAATSHVADGVGDVIAANTARKFVYYTGTALWYRLA